LDHIFRIIAGTLLDGAEGEKARDKQGNPRWRKATNHAISRKVPGKDEEEKFAAPKLGKLIPTCSELFFYVFEVDRARRSYICASRLPRLNVRAEKSLSDRSFTISKAERICQSELSARKLPTEGSEAALLALFDSMLNS
jgi:hypothetical protein